MDTTFTADDTLIAGPELPLKATFFPLGFPLELATNSELIIDAAARSWDIFRKEFPEKPVSISLAVTETEEASLPPQPKFRSQAHLMSVVSNPANQAMVDFSQRCAVGWVSKNTAQSQQVVRQYFLEACAGSLITHTHLAPIHGALVIWENKGILLCGDSFAGKSTLAYACARTGWTFVCDDGSFLVRNATGRHAIGNPHLLRLREDAKRLFPELADCLVKQRVNGKIGMEISTASLPITIASGSQIDHVVFLERGPGSDRKQDTELERLRAEDAQGWFESRANYGDARTQAEQRRSYERLMGAPVWRMYYEDLDDAIRCLETLTN